MAVVLSISLIGLLSLLGIWMILGSGISQRIAKAKTRHEQAINLADAALQLGLRCIAVNTPAPSFQQLVTSVSDTDTSPPPPIANGLPRYMALTSLPHGVGNGVDGEFHTEVRFLGYDDNVPPGWEIKGASGYNICGTMYYQPWGEGEVRLPRSQGNAVSAVSAFTIKISP